MKDKADVVDAVNDKQLWASVEWNERSAAVKVEMGWGADNKLALESSSGTVQNSKYVLLHVISYKCYFYVTFHMSFTHMCQF